MSLAQDMEKCWAVVNAALNFGFYQMQEIS